MEEVTVYLPTPSVRDIDTVRPIRLESLVGQRVAVLDNGWKCMPEFARYAEAWLLEMGAAEVVHVEIAHGRPTSPETLQRISEEVVATITGLGN